MKIVILTNEYPPNVYGGAGVHVEYLVREIAHLEENAEAVRVLCFGNQRLRERNLRVYGVDRDLQYTARELQYPELLHTLIREVAMAGSVDAADIIHCHTWYTHLAGCLLKQLVGGRLVLTTHSLEPHRPWKLEQLGTAYNASLWMEKTAYENADGVVAVSRSMKDDVLQLYNVPNDRIRVIPNGIDIEEYQPRLNSEVLHRYGINSIKPFILFVGRITRQKGIVHLVNAIPHIKANVQIVLCAGAADTRGLEQEISQRVEAAREKTGNEIIWIPQIVPKPDIINIYSAASLFVCPSIYEPFGIINLEAMACGTPVVASAVGGIPEIVVPGETGLLVPFASVDSHSEPIDPGQFSRDLASAVDSLLNAPENIEHMRAKARQRVEKLFSWKSVAMQTLDFYRKLLQLFRK
jgi:starch synthase